MINQIKSECLCCRRNSGRYCGSDLNTYNDCRFNSHCQPNVIFYCNSTYIHSKAVRECDSHSGPCIQVDVGSARCQK